MYAVLAVIRGPPVAQVWWFMPRVLPQCDIARYSPDGVTSRDHRSVGGVMANQYDRVGVLWMRSYDATKRLANAAEYRRDAGLRRYAQRSRAFLDGVTDWLLTHPAGR